MPVWLAWFITFNALNLSFVIFRAESWQNAFDIIAAMFGNDELVLSLTHLQAENDIYFYLLAAFVLVLYFKNSTDLGKNFDGSKKFLLGSIIMFIYSVLLMNNVSEFLYFNF